MNNNVALPFGDRRTSGEIGLSGSVIGKGDARRKTGAASAPAKVLLARFVLSALGRFRHDFP
tara:strand:+ start:56011 stop:56196 length:186 start_codon:yes stop_codon:yes gene_type:complete